MKKPGSPIQFTRGLHFFGRITANLSHEMNNVITIIGEVSGLLDDLLLLAEKGRPLDTEKLKSLSENIKRQTRRGRALITCMNYLGHSTDTPKKEIDLNLLAENIGSLSRRIVERKGATLDVKCALSPIMAVCGPFSVLQSVFLCLDMALEAGAISEPVSISTYAGEHGPCLSVRSAWYEHGDRDLETLAHIGALLTETGGAITTSVGSDGGRTILVQFHHSGE